MIKHKTWLTDVYIPVEWHKRISPVGLRFIMSKFRYKNNRYVIDISKNTPFKNFLSVSFKREDNKLLEQGSIFVIGGGYKIVFIQERTRRTYV